MSAARAIDRDGPTPEMMRRLCVDRSGYGWVRHTHDPLAYRYRRAYPARGFLP